jgi:hypothetical protein
MALVAYSAERGHVRGPVLGLIIGITFHYDHIW